MRYLLINADDYGIGPATSEGILQLAQRGLLSSSVLMANSPYAEEAVRAWRAAGGQATLELGWHPALTNDAPLLPAAQVPSLVDEHGRFLRLGQFLRQWMRGRIDPAHVRAELTAQYERCTELLGAPPTVVNTHHHVQVFAPVGTILKDIVCRDGQVPYLRLVREPWPMLWKVPGARIKRLILNWYGRRAGRRQRRRGLVGNDWLIGVTNPSCVHDPDFLVRLVQTVPGNVVELTCHPGLLDTTLVGRDCTEDDGMLQRRVREMELLSDPRFAQACQKAGFTIIRPRELAALYRERRGKSANSA
jgi:predicted glycoside hydrolase/deacetylase ChbG (UPF0249 family)